MNGKRKEEEEKTDKGLGGEIFYRKKEDRMWVEVRCKSEEKGREEKERKEK